MPAEASVTNEEKVLVTVNPVTSHGRPAALDGPITVEVQSGSGTFELQDDKSFYAISSDDPGDTVYVIHGDADLGSGIVDVSDVVVLHVAGANASNLGITVGAPVEK